MILGLVALAIFFAASYAYMTRQGRSSEGALAERRDANILQSGWGYLPGAVADAEGLHVNYLGRKIVDQDGGGGQANPPVNLYGTHFRISGDFEMRIAIKDIAGSAGLQFYGSPPVIKDEFRVEPKSFRVTLNGSQATVARWNGYEGQVLSSQEPSSTDQYTFSPQSLNTLTLTRQRSTVNIKINNTVIANFPENGLFDSGTLWLGMDADAPGDHWTVSNMQIDGHILVENVEKAAATTKRANGFQQYALSRRSDFLIGTAVALGPLVADGKYAELVFGGNFGQVTTENALKWQSIHPQPSVYDFREADAIVALAKKNHLAVHGHTLVFGEANPSWVQDLPLTTAADKLKVRDTMTDHINYTMGHYRGKISSWDVVNEPIGEDDTGLRQHIWYQAMGEDYIRVAFVAAKQADPRAKLFINEYGLEQDGDRWETFLSLMTRLKADGVPIDGVGLQAHVYDIENDAIDPDILRVHIQSLARLGLIVRISEMDVDSSGGEELQARQYATVLDACLAEAACVSWSTWGVGDAYNMWQNDERKLQQGQDLLWNVEYQPTKAVSRLTTTLTDR